MIDLIQLRALAEKATPGAWTHRQLDPDDSGFVQAPRSDPQHPYDIEILGDDENLYPTKAADGAFIAAANPQAIIELLDMLARAVEQ